MAGSPEGPLVAITLNSAANNPLQPTCRKLRAVGFDARVESIRDDSLVPFSRYTLAELAKPEVASRINSVVAGMLWLPAEAALDNPRGLLTLDYVLAVAQKP